MKNSWKPEAYTTTWSCARWSRTHRTTRPQCSSSLLRCRQPRDQSLSVVRKPKSVHAIRRLELAFADQRSFVIRSDYGAVDRAFHLVAFYGKGNFLGHRLAFCRRLVHWRRGSAASVHLEWRGTEAADDEPSVAISRAVKIALLV